MKIRERLMGIALEQVAWKIKDIHFKPDKSYTLEHRNFLAKNIHFLRTSLKRIEEEIK